MGMDVNTSHSPLNQPQLTISPAPTETTPMVQSLEFSLATIPSSSTTPTNNRTQRPKSKTATLKPTKSITKAHSKISQPHLLSATTEAKYRKMRAHIQTGFPVIFDVHVDILEMFKHVGWECLISYTEACIYPELLCEFFANMFPVKDDSGNIFYIESMVQQKCVKIEEDLLIKALHLNSSMLELPKENYYLKNEENSIESLLAFQLHLSTACDCVIPPNMFTSPQKISPIYFTATSQFLARIVKTNIMPHRIEKLIEPADLYIMHSLITGHVRFGLPYFILSSVCACFENNFVSYVLLMNKVFEYLRLKLYVETPMLVQPLLTSNRLFVPPRPLSLFAPNDESLPSDQDVFVQLKIINSVQSSMMENMTILNSNQIIMHNELLSLQAFLGDKAAKL